MGFHCGRQGPHIEDGFSQFHRPEHPARTSGTAGPRHVLSARADADGNAARSCAPTPRRCRSAPCRMTEPPIRIVVPGRTFRADYDATHTPMFHQIEGLVIDTSTHMGHLKGTPDRVLPRVFSTLTICRSVSGRAYFPFTEPSRPKSTSAVQPRGRAGSSHRRTAPTGWKFSAAAWSIRRCWRTAASIRPRSTRDSPSAWGSNAHRDAEIRYSRPSHLLRQRICDG